MPTRKSPLLITALLLWVACLVAQQPTTQPRHALVRVHFSETHTIRTLAELGMECDHGHYQRGRFLENVFSEDELARIRVAGFQCEVLVDDMTTHYLAHRDDPAPMEERSPQCDGFVAAKGWKTPANYTYGSMGGYHTWNELLQVLDNMRTKFPSLISVKTSVSPNLNTAEGRPIYWLRISDNPNQEEAEPKVLYTALHHAREPNSLSQTLFYMWYLLENYAVDPEIKALVDNTEMYFIPCVNPDGYVYNQTTNPTGGGYWRKNRGSDGGVDLNRNYGHNWGYDDAGSSPDPSSATYRGPAAFSEPETQAIQLFCKSRDFKVALNAHAYGNLLIYPYGYNNQPTPDQTLFNGISTLMSSDNTFVNGLASETVGYAANGNSDDWMYTEIPEKGLVLSMTPEIGPSFWPIPSQIDKLNKSMMWTNLTAARILHHYGVAEPEPLFLTDYAGEVSFTIKRYGLMDGSLSVALKPVSTNVISTGNPMVFTLAPLASAQGAITFALSPATLPGDDVLFLLTVSNGVFAYSDTVRTIFHSNSPDPALVKIFDDPAGNVQNWTATGNWWYTIQHFASAPSSLTDSPNVNYQSNKNTRITLKSPISLATATAAKLTFLTRWDIEKGYDYAQVMGSANGITFTPLCGKFTQPGTKNQDEGQPIYDGKQLDWVEEEVDLSDYLGGNLWLRFRMVSDSTQSADGFYVDDVVVKISSLPSATATLDAHSLQLQISPNPAASEATVRIIDPTNSVGENAILWVYDALGKTIARRDVSVGSWEVFQTDVWQPGLYIAKLETRGNPPVARRFLVVR